jgi:acetyl esterase/lipase
LVGGESAGADIALAVAHLYREEVAKGAPPLTGIFSSLCSAVSEESVPEKYRNLFISMEQNKGAPYVSEEAAMFVRSKGNTLCSFSRYTKLTPDIEVYKPDLKSEMAAPILYDHEGIPKTYFVACGLDPLRDCTLITEQVWKDAEIETRLDVYPGLPHAAWAFNPTAQFTERFTSNREAGLRWLLS